MENKFIQKHLTILWFSFFLCSAVLYYICPKGPPNSYWVNGGILFQISMFIFWLVSTNRQRDGNWYHPVVFFSISYLIVFSQIPWIVTNVNYVQPFILSIVPYPELINKSIMIAVLGLSSLYFGHSFKYRFDEINNSTNTYNRLFSQTALKNTIKVVLLICWITFFVFFALVGKQLYIDFIYDGTLSWGWGSTYVYIIMFLMTGFLTALEAIRLSHMDIRSFKEFFQEYNKYVLGFLVLSNLAFILSGERGTVIAMGFNFISPYFIFIHPLRSTRFLVLIILGSILMTFLGNIRTRDINQSRADRITSGMNKISELSYSRPSEWPTFGLAASYGVYNTTLGIIPLRYPYEYGRYLWGDISQIFPFYEQFFPSGKNYIGHSSLFLTNYLQKGDMSVGMGTSVLGDIYMDYGIYGIPVIMFILGFLLKVFFVKVRQMHSPNAVLYMCIFSYSLFAALRTPRSTPFFAIQYIVWSIIIYYSYIKRLLWRYSNQ